MLWLWLTLQVTWLLLSKPIRVYCFNLNFGVLGTRTQGGSRCRRMHWAMAAPRNLYFVYDIKERLCCKSTISLVSYNQNSFFKYWSQIIHNRQERETNCVNNYNDCKNIYNNDDKYSDFHNQQSNAKVWSFYGEEHGPIEEDWPAGIDPPDDPQSPRAEQHQLGLETSGINNLCHMW